jgi:polysaccharide export outer membrane protein
MLLLCHIRSALIATLLAASLGACALAPGMRFKAGAPVDPTDPNSAPVVKQITPELVREQKAEIDLAGDHVEQLIGTPKPYKVGASDVLSIITWDHPELVVPNLTYTIGDTAGQMPSGPGLSTQAVPGFVVDDEGRIQYPYIGAVKAAGLTVSQLGC